MWKGGFARAGAGSCFPWDFIHHGEFLGFSICSAWVWPPGNAQQIARQPVSCDSSICIGLPIKGLMFDWSFLRMRCGEILLGLLRRHAGKSFTLGIERTCREDSLRSVRKSSQTWQNALSLPPCYRPSWIVTSFYRSKVRHLIKGK
jgi:hypothetical protein